MVRVVADRIGVDRGVVRANRLVRDSIVIVMWLLLMLLVLLLLL